MTTTQTRNDVYHSRLEDHWEIVDRVDPVVYGNADGPLPREKVDAFDAAGYLFEENLFDEEEIRAFAAEAHRICREAAENDWPGVIREPGSDTLRSVFRLHRDEAFRSLVCRDARVVDRVRQILGSDLYIHQSRVNLKPAFDGKEFFWHSDFETWHIEDGMPRMRAISVAINLTELNEFNGPLMVIPGSHRHYVRCAGETPDDHYKKSLRKQEYGVPSREALEKLVEQGGIIAPKGPPGCALFFDCNLMHGSCGNLSPHPREGLFMVYNSVENAVQDPFGGLPPRPEFLAERVVEPV